jgi:hypothetical protein
MVFWLGILVSGLFAWYAIKMGFYETWAFVFNIIISIYLAVFLRPIIANIPGVGDTPYINALTMAGTAIGAFLILHGISYTFLTGQFRVSFPKILETLGCGFLGFLAGFLVWSFAGLLICITPISQNSFVKKIGLESQFRQNNASVIYWWCNLVNTAVSSENNRITSEQAISELLKSAEPKAQVEPAEPAESSDVETGITEQEQLDPPPEADAEDI